MIDIALLYKIIEIVFLIKKILISFYNKKKNICAFSFFICFKLFGYLLAKGCLPKSKTSEVLLESHILHFIQIFFLT